MEGETDHTEAPMEVEPIETSTVTSSDCPKTQSTGESCMTKDIHMEEAKDVSIPQNSAESIAELKNNDALAANSKSVEFVTVDSKLALSKGTPPGGTDGEIESVSNVSDAPASSQSIEKTDSSSDVKETSDQAKGTDAKSPDSKRSKPNVNDEKKAVEKSVQNQAGVSLKKADSDAMRILDKAADQKHAPQLDTQDEDEERVLEFPKTLHDFGFHFTDNKELRSIEGDEPFEFRYKEDDHFYNQKRYEALGEIITEHVYELLDKEGLERVFIPVDGAAGQPRGFFFMSHGALEKETLLLLIHGSGVVRAGQWTRKLIINNDLDKGTQLPYIRFGIEQGFGVIVLNTNQNKGMATIGDEQVEKRITCSDFPETHAFYVWDNFIKDSSIRHIAVVAHSYGGIVTSYLAEERMKDFQQRVFAMAFTDSVHSLQMIDASKRTQVFFAEHGINWVSSNLPLDEVVPYQSRRPDAKKVSAGHEKHEWTSYAAMPSVFQYIRDKHRHRQQNPNGDSFCTNL